MSFFNPIPTHPSLFAKQVYVAKAEVDREDETEDGRERLPDFTYGLLTHKYGLKSIIDQQMWDLLVTLEFHREADAEVEVFAQFLEESRTLPELSFFLFVNERLATTHAGRYLASRRATDIDYVDAVRAKQVRRGCLGSGVGNERRCEGVDVGWKAQPDPFPWGGGFMAFG